MNPCSDSFLMIFLLSLSISMCKYIHNICAPHKWRCANIYTILDAERLDLTSAVEGGQFGKTHTTRMLAAPSRPQALHLARGSTSCLGGIESPHGMLASCPQWQKMKSVRISISGAA